MAHEGRGGLTSASRSEGSSGASESTTTAEIAAQPAAQAAPPRVVLTSAFDREHPRVPYQGTPVPSLATPIAAPAERVRRLPAPRALRLSVAGLALLTACSMGGLVVLHDRPLWFTKLRHFVPTGTVVHSRSTVRAPATTLPPAAESGLTISSIVPATGRSGERVEILGTHLFGPGGYLVATFAGAVVPTNCPSEDVCDATVPAKPAGSDTATVQIRTNSGVSNALTFHYQ